MKNPGRPALKKGKQVNLKDTKNRREKRNFIFSRPWFPGLEDHFQGNGKWLLSLLHIVFMERLLLEA
jgi:hypothetical protein